MEQCRFLSETYLSSLKNCDENKEFEKNLINLDLCNIGAPQAWISDRSKKDFVDGPKILQIRKVKDVSASTRETTGESDNQVAQSLHRLTLTDGQMSIVGVEYKSKISGLSVKKVLPGSKLLLIGRVSIRRNFLLLDNDNCRLIGGRVEKLASNWKAKRMFDNFKRAENVNTTDSESKELSGKLIITDTSTEATNREEAEFNIQRQEMIDKQKIEKSTIKEKSANDYQNAMCKLTSMGFTQVNCEAALRRSHNQIEPAIDWLVNGDQRSSNLSNDRRNENNTEQRGRKDKRGKKKEFDEDADNYQPKQKSSTLFDFLDDKIDIQKDYNSENVNRRHYESTDSGLSKKYSQRSSQPSAANSDTFNTYKEPYDTSRDTYNSSKDNTRREQFNSTRGNHGGPRNSRETRNVSRSGCSYSANNNRDYSNRAVRGQRNDRHRDNKHDNYRNGNSENQFANSKENIRRTRDANPDSRNEFENYARGNYARGNDYRRGKSNGGSLRYVSTANPHDEFKSYRSDEFEVPYGYEQQRCNQLHDGGTQNLRNDFDKGNNQYQNRGSNFDKGNNQYQNRGSNFDKGNNQYQNRGSNFDKGNNQYQNRGSNFDKGNNQYQNRGSNFEGENNQMHISKNNFHKYENNYERGNTKFQNYASNSGRGNNRSHNEASNFEIGNNQIQNFGNNLVKGNDRAQKRESNFQGDPSQNLMNHLKKDNHYDNQRDLHQYNVDNKNQYRNNEGDQMINRQNINGYQINHYSQRNYQNKTNYNRNSYNNDFNGDNKSKINSQYPDETQFRDNKLKQRNNLQNEDDYKNMKINDNKKNSNNLQMKPGYSNYKQNTREVTGVEPSFKSSSNPSSRYCKLADNQNKQTGKIPRDSKSRIDPLMYGFDSREQSSRSLIGGGFDTDMNNITKSITKIGISTSHNFSSAQVEKKDKGNKYIPYKAPNERH